MLKLYIILLSIFSTTLCFAELAGFDGRFTLKVPPYAIEITGKNKFCIQKISYKNYVIGNDKGFYGTILANAKAKFIGAGHTEGGIEQVQSFNVQLDGKAVDFKAGIVLSGSEIRCQKISIQDKLMVYVDFTLTKDGIRIDKRFEALEKQNIYSFYIFQFCWSSKTKEWLIGRPDGTFAEGAFKSNKSWHLRREREIFWYSLFSTEAQKGILGYFISYYPQQGRYMFWDKLIYHKFYYSAALPKVVPKGMKSHKYSMFIKGFETEPVNWKKTAKTLAVALEKKYPLPKPPNEIVYNFDKNVNKCLELKGNGKFMCKKLALNLVKNQNYNISFRIKKSDKVSQIPSDNNLLIGQYDKKRKFQVLASFGSRVLRDDKWHQITGEFKTPQSISNANIYIYNKRTHASVWVDDLKIKISN